MKHQVTPAKPLGETYLEMFGLIEVSSSYFCIHRYHRCHKMPMTQSLGTRGLPSQGPSSLQVWSKIWALQIASLLRTVHQLLSDLWCHANLHKHLPRWKFSRQNFRGPQGPSRLCSCSLWFEPQFCVQVKQAKDQLWGTKNSKLIVRFQDSHSFLLLLKLLKCAFGYSKLHVFCVVMLCWLLLHIYFLPSIQQHLFERCFGRSPLQLRPSTSPSASTTRAGHQFAAFCSPPLAHAVTLYTHTHRCLDSRGSRAATFLRSSF